MNRVKVKKGQLWERRKDNVQIRITSGKGNEWFSIRPTNGNIQHHITTFELHNYWQYIDERDKSKTDDTEET